MRRLVLFNQSTGPLFKQLAEGLSRGYMEGCLLVRGSSSDVNDSDSESPSLRVVYAPAYDRKTRFHRVLSWFRYTMAITPYILFARKDDGVLLASNPPLVGPWIWLLSVIRRTRYAVLVYDIHPDVLVGLGALSQNGLRARLWRAVNKRVYRRASAVITIGSRMASLLQRQVGDRGPKITVVPPWVDISAIRPLRREQNPHAATYTPDSRVVVLYSGNMGASHDIDSILEAGRQLRDEASIFFLLIGEGEKYVEAANFVHHNHLSNMRVLPFQPEEMLSFTLPLGDISLVALDEGMEDLMVPSKTFSYLASGSALVAIANEPSGLSEVLAKGDIGVRVPPRQPAQLAEVICALASDPDRLARMKGEARRVAVKYYSREAGVAAFAQILDEAGLGPTN